MTTAVTLIEYLSTLPPETEIEVLHEKRLPWNSVYNFEPLVLDSLSNECSFYFMDFRDNPHTPEGHCMHGKCFLQLGNQ